jgi:hypothetical protein
MVNPNRNRGPLGSGKDKEPWHVLMRERFLPLVRRAISGGPVRYDYGYGDATHKNQILAEFKPDDGRKKNWQMWIPFFNNALTAFSCFVNGNINITSWNYVGHPTYERYGHSRLGVWKGTIKDFLRDAGIIENAFKQLNPSASVGAQGEVKLIHSDLGMIVMRSEGQQYEAYHPDFYLRAKRRFVRAPRTMIFGKHAFGRLVEDFSR